MSEKLYQSKQNGPHSFLDKLTGRWAGTSKTWFDPAKLEDESPIQGSIKSILDGRFVVHEYTSGFKGDVISGMAIIGYNLDLQKYQCAWIDSFHNGSAIMFSQGEIGNKDLKVLGSYAYITPETEQHWGWRTEIKMPDENKIIMTAFNISPEGEETKATEIIYNRS